MKRPRERSSVVVRAAAIGSLAIVIVVAIWASRWSAGTAPATETRPTTDEVGAIAPPRLESAPFEPVEPPPESRVALRASTPARRPPPPRPAAAPPPRPPVVDDAWYVDVDLANPDGRILDRPSANAFLSAGRNRPRFAVTTSPPPERWPGGSYEARRGRRLVGEATRADRTSFARLRIRADPPLYLSMDVRGNVVASARLDTRVDRARLVLQVESPATLQCSLTCLVVDAQTDAPFPRAFASLTGPGVVDVARIEIDGTGILRRADLLPGHYRLSLRGVSSGDPSSAEAWSGREIRNFDLRAGETDLGTIRIDAPQHFSGRFVDERGQPMDANGLVRPFDIDETVEWLQEEPGTSVTVKDSGKFVCDDLAKERYVLVAWGRAASGKERPTLVRALLVDLREGSVDDLVVRLERAYPVVLHAETEETKDFVFRIADADGIQFARGVVAQPRTWWFAPGDYRALVGPDFGHLREIPFTLGTQKVTIPVEP